MDSWNKLTRVLTHEIMNSVTPITSLSETLLQLTKNEKKSIATNYKADFRPFVPQVRACWLLLNPTGSSHTFRHQYQDCSM